jgi:cytochrome oxidase Cu insertion factor (SCO1/SenC/PrrC family)
MAGRRSVGVFVVVALVALACQGRPAPSSAADPKDAAIPGARELKVGEDAPDFSLPGTDGKTYRLADFKGRQAVVLAWFAKAFTGP